MEIYFVGYPTNLYLTLYDGIHQTSTDLTMEIEKLDRYGARATVSTDCEDPEHTGWIGFRLDWEGGSANFPVQLCRGGLKWKHHKNATASLRPPAPTAAATASRDGSQA